MLRPPSDATAWTRWLIELYWPLRTTTKWGEPIPFDSIAGYLEMRGHDPETLFDWILICDAAVLGWMNEETERHRKTAMGNPSGRRSTRH